MPDRFSFVHAAFQACRNTTNENWGSDYPSFEEIFHAVRVLNLTLPPDRRLRILLGDPPFDWAKVKDAGDLYPADRQRFVADLILRESVAKKRRTLIVYGDQHLRRDTRSIVSYLESYGQKVFTIWTTTAAGLSFGQSDAMSWPVPSLSMVRGTRLGAAELPIWHPLRLEQRFDAVLNLGRFSPGGISSGILCGPGVHEAAAVSNGSSRPRGRVAALLRIDQIGSSQMRTLAFVVAMAMLMSSASARRPSDAIPATGGDIVITPIAHGTVHISYGPHVVLVDPTLMGGWDPPYPGNVVPKVSFEGLKPPTHILITDVHGDHLDGDSIAALRTPTTDVVMPGDGGAGWQWIPRATQIANGQAKTVGGVSIEAVPMYNLARGPTATANFHDKGRGNGYVVTLGGKRLYLSGDTECTPEMKALKNIDVAFIAMNLPFTATPAEAAECAKAFKPKVAYPYHFKGQDVKIFETALAGSGIEVRLRSWYP